jgi:uncharacterized protein YycO
MIGDVIFFKKSDSFISRMIAYFIQGDYTHVGLIVSYDELTNVATIIESDRFVNTRVNMIELDQQKHEVYTVHKTQEQIDRVLKYAYDSVGMKYDYWQILGLFLSLLFKTEHRFFDKSNKLICSELIDLSYYRAGIKRCTDMNLGNVTPQELLQVYDFRIRKG